MERCDFICYCYCFIFLNAATLIFNNVAFANIGLRNCGIYHFKGIILAKEGKLSIIINPKTKSEYQLNISINDFPKITPYISLDFRKIVTGELNIYKIHHSWNANAKDLQKIDISVSDPLNPNLNSFLKLIKEERCH